MGEEVKEVGNASPRISMQALRQAGEPQENHAAAGPRLKWADSVISALSEPATQASAAKDARCQSTDKPFNDVFLQEAIQHFRDTLPVDLKGKYDALRKADAHIQNDFHKLVRVAYASEEHIGDAAIKDIKRFLGRVSVDKNGKPKAKSFWEAYDKASTTLGDRIKNAGISDILASYVKGSVTPHLKAFVEGKLNGEISEQGLRDLVNKHASEAQQRLIGNAQELSNGVSGQGLISALDSALQYAGNTHKLLRNLGKQGEPAGPTDPQDAKTPPQAAQRETARNVGGPDAPATPDGPATPNGPDARGIHIENSPVFNNTIQLEGLTKVLEKLVDHLIARDLEQTLRNDASASPDSPASSDREKIGADVLDGGHSPSDAESLVSEPVDDMLLQQPNVDETRDDVDERVPQETSSERTDSTPAQSPPSDAWVKDESGDWKAPTLERVYTSGGFGRFDPLGNNGRPQIVGATGTSGPGRRSDAIGGLAEQGTATLTPANTNDEKPVGGGASIAQAPFSEATSTASASDDMRPAGPPQSGVQRSGGWVRENGKWSRTDSGVGVERRVKTTEGFGRHDPWSNMPMPRNAGAAVSGASVSGGWAKENGKWTQGGASSVDGRQTAAGRVYTTEGFGRIDPWGNNRISAKPGSEARETKSVVGSRNAAASGAAEIGIEDAAKPDARSSIADRYGESDPLRADIIRGSRYKRGTATSIRLTEQQHGESEVLGDVI
ncbi:hypothetical protein [Burkholderia ubonensis]|uniref:hypothetical protein n=1 Tax=Burkholderia ubonensis TaxID=101571 RepID=UPI0012F72534|nr:hypothetical protein [Burkholderia ubonensis]